MNPRPEDSDRWRGVPEADPTRRLPHVSREPGGSPDADPTSVLPPAPPQGVVRGWYRDGRRPPSQPPQPPRRPPNQGYGQGYGSAAEPPLPPELSPRRQAAAAPPPPPGGQPPRKRRRWSWRKRVGVTVLALVVLIVGTGLGTYFWANGKLNRQAVLTDYPGRPAKGKGTNYLIVGSDSRQGMTKAEEKAWHTGYAAGQRTDSMMIMHTGSHGTTLLSIPRDSYVTIPAWTDSTGHKHAASQNKINAAYSYGGGKLLAETIEYNTGIHLDHYTEIGFNGFVQIVDKVGGVHICLDKAIKDKASGANLKAGCQNLDGQQALAYVRERHQEANQDLGREQHQQKFLSALSHQAASPMTVLDPFKLYPTMSAGLDALVVDKNMSIITLGKEFWDLKGAKGHSMLVPIANANYQTPAGDAVKWDMSKAKQIFDAFKTDSKVPNFG